MKLNKSYTLICVVFISMFYLNSSAQMVEAMNLKYVIPEGFEKEKNNEYDKMPALGGPLIRLISVKKDILIAINLLQHDTTETGQRNIQWIKDHFNPNHERNQNYYNYVKMLADSIKFPIVRMDEIELKNYNADYGAEFTIKDEKNPYLPDFPVGKGRTMFKWKRGDIFLFYFFKPEVTQKERERVLQQTKGIMIYK